MVRWFSREAREVLSAAAAVARFRGAQECEISDIKVADLLLSLHPGATLYADASTSTSPQQLPMSSVLQDLLTSTSDELGLDELRQLADEP
jgi:hypothetical protein